jgi:plasmid stabilization system protein ParE
VKLARFTAQAKAELLAQTAYFETIRKGLGARFRTEAESAAARAAAFPEHGRLAPRNARRRRVVDFKFSLVYTQTEYGVLIHAVAADHRMPEYWVGRLPRLAS